MDGSVPASSVHGISLAIIVEWVAISFSQGIFLTQESNPGLLPSRQILNHLSQQGSPFKSKVLQKLAMIIDAKGIEHWPYLLSTDLS